MFGFGYRRMETHSDYKARGNPRELLSRLQTDYAGECSNKVDPNYIIP